MIKKIKELTAGDLFSLCTGRFTLVYGYQSGNSFPLSSWDVYLVLHNETHTSKDEKKSDYRMLFFLHPQITDEIMGLFYYRADDDEPVEVFEKKIK